MRSYFFSAVYFLSCVAYGQVHSPKFEFRAVWVATVTNIDWPSRPDLPVSEQQQEIIGILDMHRQLGMNAVILQVRPASDAFYPSALEPWSRYLSGVPGKAPDPYYDPLQFWIAEAHKRGMELHAWLNPFRVALDFRQPLAGNHIAFRHPEWILKYGNSLYFDPGLPGTREFVALVVKDIVQRYDVDAIHFDDYFYPYPLSEDFPDDNSFAVYNRGFFPESKADWRRENVDILIKMLNDTIKAVKPWVKFGISPFGVWRNRIDDPEGSDSRAGITNYDHLYANIIKWQEKGWIDYTLPQLYWHIGHPLADFKKLALWWEQHAYGRGMFIGHSVYKSEAASETEAWTRPGELPQQVRLLREIPGISGSAFYSSKHFRRYLMGFHDSLMQDLYRYPALVPPAPWLDNQPPLPVRKISRRGSIIRWKTEKAKSGQEEPSRFIIYFCETDRPFDPGNPEFIHAIPGKEERSCQFNRINPKKKRYSVWISAIDRLNNESRLSGPVHIRL